MTELQFQKSVKRYLDLALPPGTFWTHFPAGGGGKARGAKLKAMGLVPGVPDILIIHDGRACWIELKTKGGRVSADQIATGRQLELAGSQTYLARTLGEVADALDAFGIETKARAA